MSSGGLPTTEVMRCASISASVISLVRCRGEGKEGSGASDQRDMRGILRSRLYVPAGVCGHCMFNGRVDGRGDVVAARVRHAEIEDSPASAGVSYGRWTAERRECSELGRQGHAMCQPESALRPSTRTGITVRIVVIPSAAVKIKTRSTMRPSRRSTRQTC